MFNLLLLDPSLCFCFCCTRCRGLYGEAVPKRSSFLSCRYTKGKDFTINLRKGKKKCNLTIERVSFTFLKIQTKLPNTQLFLVFQGATEEQNY